MISMIILFDYILLFESIFLVQLDNSLININIVLMVKIEELLLLSSIIVLI